MFPGDERAHLRLRVLRGADLEFRDPLLEERQQPVARVPDRHHHGDRHAALARRTVGGRDRCVRCQFEIRIRQNQHVILRAAQSLHALALLCPLLVEGTGHRRGAHEAQGRHVGMRDQCLHGHAVAVHDVEDTIRKPRRREEFRETVGSGGILFRGLEDRAVPAGNGDGKHPERHHGGKIEGRDASHHAQGLADGGEVDAGRNLGGVLPLQELRDPTGEFHGLETPLHFTPGVGQRLAVLTRNDGRQFVPRLLEQAAKAKQDLRSLGDRCIAPGREDRPGSRHGRSDLRGVRKGHPRSFGSSRGVEDRPRAPGLTVPGLPIDPVGDTRLHAAPASVLPPFYRARASRTARPFPSPDST